MVDALRRTLGERMVAGGSRWAVWWQSKACSAERAAVRATSTSGDGLRTPTGPMLGKRELRRLASRTVGAAVDTGQVDGAARKKDEPPLPTSRLCTCTMVHAPAQRLSRAAWRRRTRRFAIQPTRPEAGSPARRRRCTSAESIGLHVGARSVDGLHVTENGEL